MKKLYVFLAVCLITVCGGFVEAQNIPKEFEAELYCVNVPVQKVFPYTKGYIVVYRTGVNQTGTVYIPSEWFRYGSTKAQLSQLGAGKAQPSMTVFYKAGEFHSVRLYVSRYQAHESWGFIPSDVNIDSRFAGIEKLELHF